MNFWKRQNRQILITEIEDECQQGRNINVDFIGELRSEQDKALKELVNTITEYFMQQQHLAKLWSVVQ